MLSGAQAIGVEKADFAKIRAYGQRALLFGDSITANNHYTTGENSNGNAGFITHFNWRNGQRLYAPVSLNKGVSGNTTTQMLARYGSDVAANYANFDWLFVLGGTNDLIFGQAGPTVSYPRSIPKETTLLNLQTICLNALQAGKVVVLQTIYPRAGTGWNPITDSAGKTGLMKEMAWINQSLRQWVRTLSQRLPIYLIDCYRDLMDPTSSTGTGQANLSLFPDGLHPNGAGCSLIAKRMDAELSRLLGPQPIYWPSLGDLYDSTLNPLGNLLTNNGSFSTTTGGTATNVSGSVPAGWQVTRSRAGVNAEVAVSTTANAAGYDTYPGNNLVLTVALPSGESSTEQMSVISPSVASGSGYVAGDTVYGAMVVKLVTPTKFLGAKLTLIDYNGAVAFNTSDGVLNNGNGIENVDGMVLHLRTPDRVVGASGGASPTLSLNLTLYFDASATTAGATVSILGGAAIRHSL